MPGFPDWWLGSALSSFGGQLTSFALLYYLWTTAPSPWPSSCTPAPPRSRWSNVVAGLQTGFGALGAPANRTLWLALACLAVAGAADTVTVVSRTSIVQHAAPTRSAGM